MAKAKVLVVDDSLTMRALVSGMLEKDKDIQVVGLADGAEEARRMVKDLKPTVMTLDVEMPGMSGLEYLAEIMEQNPMPVVMFSTLTAKGAESSIEALRLGALDCYPKPTRATPDEVQAAIGKLAKTVKEAPARFRALHDATAKPAAKTSSEPFTWNGKLVAIGCDVASTKALFDVLGSWPADGPPVIVIQHMRPELADGMIAKLSAAVAPRVVEASEGLRPEPGMIVFARPGERHVYVDQWPGGSIRLLDKPPFAGARPSISLMLATLAKTAADKTIGVMLAGGDDGGQGAAALRGARGFAVAPAEDGSGTLELGRGMALQPIRIGEIAKTVLDMCRG
ncbi:chemotaxis response regulator protein-glutamate methylesterase [Sphingomonas metalli]|uniref:protein-glutamate methylesterase n=1 Tax=Sphingomonas metalli TaxID=1779358 RepID=A0A916SXD5_9SPHN|nr:chemotaxis protein CheB [Sphingomonas metalli]GGB21079.1 chemotaxis response regulator protein-glutamate methylesterase [Sphingomonas metalli]